MTQADSVHSTPRTNTSAIDPPIGAADCRCLMCLAEGDNSPHRRRQAPPRPLTSQQRGDNLLMRWRLARAAAHRMAARELDPRDVLIDLLGGADFDHEILDPAEAARIILERLRDAGFEVVPASSEDRA